MPEGPKEPKTLIVTPSQLSIYVKLARTTKRSAQIKKQAFEILLYLDLKMIEDLNRMSEYLECHPDELISALIFRNFLDIGNVIDFIHGSKQSFNFQVPNIDQIFMLLNYARYTKTRMPDGTGKFTSKLYVFSTMLPIITRFCEDLECDINELATALVYKNYFTQEEMAKLIDSLGKHLH